MSIICSIDNLTCTATSPPFWQCADVVNWILPKDEELKESIRSFGARQIEIQKYFKEKEDNISEKQREINDEKNKIKAKNDELIEREDDLNKKQEEFDGEKCPKKAKDNDIKEKDDLLDKKEKQAAAALCQA